MLGIAIVSASSTLIAFLPSTFTAMPVFGPALLVFVRFSAKIQYRYTKCSTSRALGVIKYDKLSLAFSNRICPIL